MRVCWVLVSALAGLVMAGVLAADERGFLVAIASIAGAALSAAIGFLLYEAFQAYRRYARGRDDEARADLTASRRGR